MFHTHNPISLMPYGIVFRGNSSDNTKGVPNVEESSSTDHKISF